MCPSTRLIVAWHVVVGLGEVTHIVVEMIPPFKIISLLAHGGLCLPCDDIFPCWCYLGNSRRKFLLKGIEDFIYLFVRHYAQHLA